jgi:hypothetical protein
MSKDKRVIVRLPSAGRVVVISKDDKKISCPHDDVVPYAIKDGWKYSFCLRCKNMIREELKREINE